MDRITDAFVWPARDPAWLTKLLIIALTLLIPIVGAINGLGWMLASLDRLRAGDERFAPANLGYIHRGLRLFVVNLAYELAVALVAALIYVPVLMVASNQSHAAANPVLFSVASSKLPTFPYRCRRCGDRVPALRQTSNREAETVGHSGRSSNPGVE